MTMDDVINIEETRCKTWFGWAECRGWVLDLNRRLESDIYTAYGCFSIFLSYTDVDFRD